MSDRDVKPANALPWVCGPGQKLPPAPPLWGLESSFGARIAVTCVPDAAQLEHGLSAENRSLGWFVAVDAEGRSR